MKKKPAKKPLAAKKPISAGVAFLQELDKEIRTTRPCRDDRTGQEYGIDDYKKDRKLNVGELKRIFAIVEDLGLILYPTTTEFGFHPCFEVLSAEVTAPGIPPEVTQLLKWRLDQSPPKWTWQRMSKHFASAAAVKHAGLDPIQGEVHYQY